MENVHKPHNLAAIARTCDSVGIGEIHAIAGNEKVQLSQKISAGTQKFIKFNLHETTKEGMEILKLKGFRIYATHISENALNYQKVDFTKSSAIVFGAELGGTSKEILEFSDQDIIIPMNGIAQSLNVSVAAGIILYEAFRQRLEAGFYDKRQISEEEFREKLFEWCQPKAAKILREKCEPYPKINDLGEIISAQQIF